MSESNYTPTEYRNDCRELATSILEQCVEYNPEATSDELREAVDEYLHESVDGHQSVIYTWRAQLVLAHSSNDDYAVTEFGAESITQASGGINWSALAYGAMFADVSEHLWPLFEEHTASQEVQA